MENLFDTAWDNQELIYQKIESLLDRSLNEKERSLVDISIKTTINSVYQLNLFGKIL